jgi:hypothetical protein
MKNRISTLFLQGLALVVTGLLAQNAQSQTTLYNNSGQAGAGTYEGNYNYGNGEVGNEVVLAGGPWDQLNTFQLQFDVVNAANGTSGTPTGLATEFLTVNFYSMTGPGGVPGQSFYTYSASLQSLGLSTYTQGETLNLTPTGVVVPQDFTWTVTFSGVPNSENAGLSIINGTPNGSGVPVPKVGFNYNDAWVNAGNANWSAVQTSPTIGGPDNPGLQFGALITGTSMAIPEPSTIALGVIGACAFLARRRKS